MILTLFAVLLLIDVICFAKEEYVWSLILFIATIFGLNYFFAILPAFTAVSAAKYAVIYLGVGMAVGTLKWFQYIARIGSELADLRSSKNPKTMKELYEYVWNNRSLRIKIRDDHTGHPNSDAEIIDYLTPKAKNFKGHISFWVIQWPITLVSFVLADVVLRIGEWFSRVLSYFVTDLGRYITKRAIGKFETNSYVSNLVDK